MNHSEHGFHLVETLFEAGLITAFVGAMMVFVEYANVLTRGRWRHGLRDRRWRQYFAGAVLGVAPGCLGSYVLVTLYTHRTVSFGALLAGMLATTGDESFVMLARMPEAAVWLFAALAVTGAAVGPLADRLLGPRRYYGGQGCSAFDLHEGEAAEAAHPAPPSPWAPNGVWAAWKRGHPIRYLLATATASVGLAAAAGLIGSHEGLWMRITIAAVMALLLLAVVTASDHFLEEHVWHHIVLRHLPRIFLWTFGVMLALAGLAELVDVHELIRENAYVVLFVALAMGLLPQSGPHIVFVTLFADGVLPLGILVANSIVQDGHGMLPLLGQSRRDFLLVKGFKLALALPLGLLLVAFGV